MSPQNKIKRAKTIKVQAKRARKNLKRRLKPRLELLKKQAKTARHLKRVKEKERLENELAQIKE